MDKEAFKTAKKLFEELDRLHKVIEFLNEYGTHFAFEDLYSPSKRIEVRHADLAETLRSALLDRVTEINNEIHEL